MGELENMAVVVTGASSGIGAATAEAVVGSGASVVLAARRVDRLEQMVARFGPSRTGTTGTTSWCLGIQMTRASSTTIRGTGRRTRCPTWPSAPRGVRCGEGIRRGGT